MTKILRAKLPDGTKVYLADNEQGIAEMPFESFKAYVVALDTIAAFEKDVNKQYELNKCPQ